MNMWIKMPFIVVYIACLFYHHKAPQTHLLRVTQSKIHRRLKLSIGMSLVMSMMNPMLLFLYPCIALLSWKQCRLKYRQIERKLQYEFPIWTRILMSHLQSSTVHNALKKALPKAPQLMKEDLKCLLETLEKDPQNRQVFLDFMKEYQNDDMKQMMKHLYHYNMISKEDAKIQLTRLLATLNVWIEKSRKEVLQARIDAHQFLGFIPLGLVGMLFMLLMFRVMTLMMEGRWML